jgi:hypothetical protein
VSPSQLTDSCLSLKSYFEAIDTTDSLPAKCVAPEDWQGSGSSRRNPPYGMCQNDLRHKLIAQAVYCEKV